MRAALLAAALATLAPAAADAGPPLGCDDLPDLVTIYFQKHVAFRSLNGELQERAVRNYLRRADPQRNLLLADEAERISRDLRLVFKQILLGNCTQLGALHEEFTKRHRTAEAFVRDYLSRDDYALDPAVQLVLDPDDRPRPRNAEERDALNRTLIHFQISNYLAADHDLEDAKRRLIHRYELRAKHWAEQDREDLYAAFLDSLASALDPHSSYLSADDLEDFRIGMQLSLEGIGVALSERDGYSVVEQIIPGGAADKLDVLQPKDKIIAVAEEGRPAVDVIDMPLRDVVRLIRGKKGSTVHLTVLRQGETTERFPVAIVRAKIDLQQQAAKLRFEKLAVAERTLKLAVLELPSFYGDSDPNHRLSSRDVRRLLRIVRDEKADGLLLDLSRNGGGLLEDAVRISGFFIRDGGVVAIKGPGDSVRVLDDPDDEILYGGPMVVLVSRVSASASEILAGALTDYQRAVVVGDDHTFGKGTVQSVFPLRPGLGALRITTALFFRPGGASTQHSGVPTHIAIPSILNHDSFGEQTQRHSLPAQSIEPFLAQDGNGNRGEARWKAVTPDLIAQLADLSNRRVEENEEFRRILELLDERERDNGVVRLEELLREREAGDERDQAELDRESDAEEDPTTPQAEEALRILADLVMLGA